VKLQGGGFCCEEPERKKSLGRGEISLKWMLNKRDGRQCIQIVLVRI
jgi:hypothetical protein